jgi:hypothetical protein
MSELEHKKTNEDQFPLADRSEDEGFDWQKDAMCAQTDPEAFFPEKGDSSLKAKKLCLLGCEAIQQCLVYALNNKEEFGVWGGHSKVERGAIIDEASRIGTSDYEALAEEAIERAQLKIKNRTRKTRILS